MSDQVKFDTDQQSTISQFKSRTVLGQPEVPGMSAWLMKKGIIKDEGKAGGILVAIVLFNFCLAAFLIYYFVF